VKILFTAEEGPRVLFRLTIASSSRWFLTLEKGRSEEAGSGEEMVLAYNGC